MTTKLEFNWFGFQTGPNWVWMNRITSLYTKIHDGTGVVLHFIYFLFCYCSVIILCPRVNIHVMQPKWGTYVAHPQKIFRSCDFLWRKLGANQLNFRIRCNVKIALFTIFHKKSLITPKFVYEIVYCALTKKIPCKILVWVAL